MRIKYDQEFMKSPEGKSLHSRWRNIRNQRCEEWEDFQVFVDWALANGFGLELQLKRHDNRVTYQPGNAYFLKPDVEDGTIGESIERWNDTVNKIRKHCGLEPLIRKCTCCGEVIPKYSDECPNCLVSVKNNESEKQDG